MKLTRLFEGILELSQVQNNLIFSFRQLGLEAKIPKSTKRMGGGIDVADNKEFNYNYKSKEHTGFFANYFKQIPGQYDDKEDDEYGFEAHINTIVVADKERGTGLGKKICDAFIDSFEGQLKAVELSDQSKGFWEHYMGKYHPEIELKVEEDED